MLRWIPLVLALGCSGDDPGSSDGDPIVAPADPYAPIVPSFELEDVDFEGARVAVYVPEDPSALLFVFHGTDGDIASVTQIDWIALYNLLVPHGVGLVIASSVDREEKVWDSHDEDATTNDDFPRLARLRDHLIETTTAEEDTPVLSIGFSNGANFAPLFTNMANDAGWNVRGFSSHQGGQQQVTGLPGIWVSAENDEISGQPDNIEPLAQQCTEFTHRTCPHYVGHEIPLHPDWFARMPNYTLAQSHAMFDELVEMEIVSESGDRLVEIEDMEAVFEEYLGTSHAPSPSLVPTQLRVVWATHRFSSEHAVEEATWFLEQL